MGPNSFRLLAELIRRSPDVVCFDRALDLGCGYALIAIPGLKEQPGGWLKQLFETWAEGDDSELFKTSAWQEWFESGHEFGARDKEFLDKGLYGILNFLLIYIKRKN